MKKEQNIISKEDLTIQYYNILKDTYKDNKVNILYPLYLEMISKNEDKIEINIEKVYKEYLIDKDNDDIIPLIKDHIAVVNNFFFSPDLNKIDINTIIPTIRTKKYLEEAISKNKDVLYECYNEDLFIFYAVNAPDHIRMINVKHLELNNISMEDLKAQSLINLRNLTKNMIVDSNNDMHILTIEDDFVESLILLPDLIKEKLPHIKTPLLILPGENIIIVSDLENEVRIKSMQLFLMMSNNCFSDELYAYDKDVNKFNIFSNSFSKF